MTRIFTTCPGDEQLKSIQFAPVKLECGQRASGSPILKRIPHLSCVWIVRFPHAPTCTIPPAQVTSQLMNSGNQLCCLGNSHQDRIPWFISVSSCAFFSPGKVIFTSNDNDLFDNFQTKFDIYYILDRIYRIYTRSYYYKYQLMENYIELISQ